MTVNGVVLLQAVFFARPEAGKLVIVATTSFVEPGFVLFSDFTRVFLKMAL